MFRLTALLLAITAAPLLALPLADRESMCSGDEKDPLCDIGAEDISAGDVGVSLLQTGMTLIPATPVDAGLPGDVLDQMMEEDDLAGCDSLNLMQTNIEMSRGPNQELASPFSDGLDEDELAGLQDAMADFSM